MNYIDKDKLKAEIERRIKVYQEQIKGNTRFQFMTLGRISEDEQLMTFLDTLQEPEVDLEKELDEFSENEMFIPDEEMFFAEQIARYFYNLNKKVKREPEVNFDKAFEDFYNANYKDGLTLEECARHFFELGRSAK